LSLITSVRVANTQMTMPAEIYPCTFRDIVLWQRRIQEPYIAPGGGIGFDWNWPRFFLGCHIIEQSCGRQAIAFQIRVPNPAGVGIPEAQAILSLPYQWPGDARENCVFVWLIAATPEEALRARGIDCRFSTLPPLLDTAIQVSLAHGLEGRIGLHADAGRTAEEAQRLVEKYERQGLRRRKAARRYYRRPARRDDGRYFYFTPDDALAYAAQQDDLR
jgi:hypothetical protein